MWTIVHYGLDSTFGGNVKDSPSSRHRFPWIRNLIIVNVYLCFYFDGAFSETALRYEKKITGPERALQRLYILIPEYVILNKSGRFAT